MNKVVRQGLVLLIFLFLVMGGRAQAETALEIIKDIQIHGFASSSYNYNFNQPLNPTNGNSNRIFDTDSNSFKFDLAELVLVKETPNPGDIGFRTDLDYGFSIPRVTHSSGNTVTTDEFDVQQGYVSYNAPLGNGLQLDFGKFITHIGAEVIEGHDGWNYNYSRSFLFGLAIPFTHTGVRAGYSLSDKVSVLGMIANGWDDTTDNNNDKTFGMQLSLAPTENISMLLNWAGGGTNAASNNSNWLNIWDVVLDFNLTNHTLLQLNFDYGSQESASALTSGETAIWWGFAGILRHDLNKWVSINLRGEFFNDEDGFRATSINGTPVKLWEFTLTPEFRLAQNMVVRLEYRHDEADKFAFKDENNNISETSQDTVAVNALFHF
jgi:hypothetical protein